MNDKIYVKPDKGGRKQQIKMLKTFNIREQIRLTKELEKLSIELSKLEEEERSL